MDCLCHIVSYLYPGSAMQFRRVSRLASQVIEECKQRCIYIHTIRGQLQAALAPLGIWGAFQAAFVPGKFRLDLFSWVFGLPQFLFVSVTRNDTDPMAAFIRRWQPYFSIHHRDQCRAWETQSCMFALETCDFALQLYGDLLVPNNFYDGKRLVYTTTK